MACSIAADSVASSVMSWSTGTVCHVTGVGLPATDGSHAVVLQEALAPPQQRVSKLLAGLDSLV